MIPITSFSAWWKDRTEYSIRKGVNRAKKLGVVTKVADFDDEFVETYVALQRDSGVPEKMVLALREEFSIHGARASDVP